MTTLAIICLRDSLRFEIADSSPGTDRRGVKGSLMGLPAGEVGVGPEKVAFLPGDPELLFIPRFKGRCEKGTIFYLRPCTAKCLASVAEL